jgi:hypothetical protein
VTISPRRPKGWSQASPLSQNGLAYLLFTGRALPLPAARLRVDLERTLADYTIWPSMGVWRDLIAGYLGIDPVGAYDFRPDFRGDTYLRSFNSIGFVLARAGIGVDLPGRRLRVSSPRDGEYPLPFLADWERGVVPVLMLRSGKATIHPQTERSAKLCVEFAPF